MNGAEKYEKFFPQYKCEKSKLINSPTESHSYITIETTIDISIVGRRSFRLWNTHKHMMRG